MNVSTSFSRLRSASALPIAVLLTALLLSACSDPSSVGGPSVAIDAPVDGATIVTSSIDVSGRVFAEGSVSLTVRNTTTGDSDSCNVAGDEFECPSVPLEAGDNTLVVTATDGQGRTGQDAANVSYDPEAGDAALTILSPASAGKTASSTIDMTGSTSGFGPGLEVSIDTGVTQGTCTAADGAFSCDDVPLLEGDNLLVISGRDDGGREAADSVFVEYDPGFSDGDAPTVEITAPADGFTTDQSWVRVEADVEDAGLIERVEALVDGVPVACDLDDETDVADCLVFLLEPSQTIEVRAEDEQGQVGSDEIVVNLDRPESAFDIELVYFDESYSPTQRDAFDDAVAIWEGIVVGDLESVDKDFDDSGDPQDGDEYACDQGEPARDGPIDDLRVYVTSFTDDSDTLGFASPCLSRIGGDDEGTNFVGIMSFNTSYLEDLEADGQLVDTIVHEIGHVMGFGTNWEFEPYYDLLRFQPSADVCSDVATFDVPPAYVGEFARLAYKRLDGNGDVPVEGDGQAGTKCGHWDEDRFGNELMTGFLNAGSNPLSELSVASFIDLGLEVDLSRAESYTPPSGLSLQSDEGLDLAGREILLPPRGGVDVRDGRLRIFDPDRDPHRELRERMRQIHRDHGAP